MKILACAYACHPHLGSESHVGWAAVQCLARDHELWVLTGLRNRPDLERAREEKLVPDNVHFIYGGQFKPWHPNRLRAHLQGWKEYANFTNEILPAATALHQKIKFDLAHHVTLASWRVPCQLWKLGIPLVFGPVGGSEEFPLRFFSILSPVTAAFDMARMFSNRYSQFSPGVRACLRHAAHVFAANAETESVIVRLRGTSSGVSRMLAYFHSNTALAAADGNRAPKNLDGPLRLFAGGTMIGSKGVTLTLRALALAKRQGLKFHYRYGGKGPDFNRSQLLAEKLGLLGDVSLGDSLSGKAYTNELQASHVYLAPSLRESAGITLAEAMLAGCVPVVADCSGPSQIVSDECGFKVPVKNPQTLIEELSKILLHLDKNRNILREKGPAAAQRIVTRFSEENYRATVNTVYQSICSGNGQ